MASSVWLRSLWTLLDSSVSAPFCILPQIYSEPSPLPYLGAARSSVFVSLFHLVVKCLLFVPLWKPSGRNLTLLLANPMAFKTPENRSCFHCYLVNLEGQKDNEVSPSKWVFLYAHEADFDLTFRNTLSSSLSWLPLLNSDVNNVCC